MAQQTALEWFSFELFGNKEITRETYNALKKASEMEKEQIINAWIATDNELQRIAAEKYYNETYKNE